MAGRDLPARSAGAPANQPLRQSVLPRTTPGRHDRGSVAKVDDVLKAGAGSGVISAGNPEVQPKNNLPVSRFDAGSSSNQGGRMESWHDEGFQGQGFGNFEEGYFEGNNGYGNGYGAMNRGNFRPRPYRQQFYPSNRGRNNNYRGGYNRFNNGSNRYQRNFSNHENLREIPSAQASDHQVVSVTREVTSSGRAASVEENMSNPLSNRAQKKVEKMLCLRCGENGHFADNCSAVLCLYCEKTSHESQNCPLHSMPKPVAITYGVSRNELIFHEIPASSDVTFKHDSGKVGKISVEGGTLTSQEIVKELAWILPGNHQWDLQPEDGAFEALFPSKADLARMTKIIRVSVPETDMFLIFEEWSAADLDPFSMAEVWVKVHGCCYKERCDYLSLFAVGSLIGKTKEVDMEYTRSHSEVRMKVEVTRPEFIPTTTVDHTYGGKGYGLLFKVEGEKAKIKSDVVMQDTDMDDDTKGTEGEEKEFSKDADLAPGGQAKNNSGQQNAPTTSSLPILQAQCSMPMVRVVLITCTNPPQSIPVSRSESQISKLSPRRLWGDSDNEDDDALPSPMPRLNLEDTKNFGLDCSNGLQNKIEDFKNDPAIASAAADVPALHGAVDPDAANSVVATTAISATTEFSAAADAKPQTLLSFPAVTGPEDRSANDLVGISQLLHCGLFSPPTLAGTAAELESLPSSFISKYNEADAV
ncbi:hypothetical protein ACQ4PT_062283 [Festuca glaucescens]